MAYKMNLTCTNCTNIQWSSDIADGTDVATYLTTPSTNADCSNCGCNTLVKT